MEARPAILACPGGRRIMSADAIISYNPQTEQHSHAHAVPSVDCN